MSGYNVMVHLDPSETVTRSRNDKSGMWITFDQLNLTLFFPKGAKSADRIMGDMQAQLAILRQNLRDEGRA